MGSINADGAAERDSAAFVAWLDARPEVDPSKKMRVGAGASFHVGGW